MWPAGKPWQRHQRLPLVATRACASGVLLIRPCKQPGKTFEDWPNSNSNCPSPSFSLSPLVSLEHSARSPTVWACVKQFAEWKVLNKSRVKVHQRCVCSAMWMLLLRDRIGKGKAKSAGCILDAIMQYMQNAQMTSFKIVQFYILCNSDKNDNI